MHDYNTGSIDVSCNSLWKHRQHGAWSIVMGRKNTTLAANVAYRPRYCNTACTVILDAHSSWPGQTTLPMRQDIPKGKQRHCCPFASRVALPVVIKATFCDVSNDASVTLKLRGGSMSIMDLIALRLDGPIFSLFTSKGTNTAWQTCACALSCAHVLLTLSSRIAIRVV